MNGGDRHEDRRRALIGAWFAQMTEAKKLEAQTRIARTKAKPVIKTGFAQMTGKARFSPKIDITDMKASGQKAFADMAAVGLVEQVWKKDEETFGRAAAAKGGPSMSFAVVDSQPVVTAAQITVGQLAAGYAPAVVKVVSYARGGKRATATGTYIHKDGVVLETHDGQELASAEAVAAEIAEWSAGFDTRRDSDDIVGLEFAIKGLENTPEGHVVLRSVIESALEGHRFAARIDAGEDGALVAKVVAVMAGKTERFRLSEAQGKPKLANKTRDIMLGRIAFETRLDPESVSIKAGKAGHGADNVKWRLQKLVSEGAAITDDLKRLFSDTHIELATRTWKRDLKSFEARDTMHLILSAKGETDPDVLKSVARSFLQETFADHKFMFGVHDDTADRAGHIHAHAVITVRDANGHKINPGPVHFKQWREAYAAIAQEQGLKIVATTAKERASSLSYGPRDKVIAETAARPRLGREAQDIIYHQANPRVAERARHRMALAKANPIRFAETQPARAVVNGSLAAWAELAKVEPQNPIVRDNIIRLNTSLLGGAVLNSLKRDLIKGTTEMATSQTMREDLKLMNQSADIAAEGLRGETKKQFMEKTDRLLMKFAVHSDLQEMKERGFTHVTAKQLEAMQADKVLVEKARAVERIEAREARLADRVAADALANEREVGGNAAQDAESIAMTEEAKQVSRVALKIAARENHESHAATQAVQDLSQNPQTPLNTEAVQTSPHLKDLKHQQERDAEVHLTKTKPQRQ